MERRIAALLAGVFFLLSSGIVSASPQSGQPLVARGSNVYGAGVGFDDQIVIGLKEQIGTPEVLDQNPPPPHSAPQAPQAPLSPRIASSLTPSLQPAAPQPPLPQAPPQQQPRPQPSPPRQPSPPQQQPLFPGQDRGPAPGIPTQPVTRPRQPVGLDQIDLTVSELITNDDKETRPAIPSNQLGPEPVGQAQPPQSQVVGVGPFPTSVPRLADIDNALTGLSPLPGRGSLGGPGATGRDNEIVLGFERNSAQAGGEAEAIPPPAQRSGSRAGPGSPQSGQEPANAPPPLPQGPSIPLSPVYSQRGENGPSVSQQPVRSQLPGPGPQQGPTQANVPQGPLSRGPISQNAPQSPDVSVRFQLTSQQGPDSGRSGGPGDQGVVRGGTTYGLGGDNSVPAPPPVPSGDINIQPEQPDTKFGVLSQAALPDNEPLNVPGPIAGPPQRPSRVLSQPPTPLSNVPPAAPRPAIAPRPTGTGGNGEGHHMGGIEWLPESIPGEPLVDYPVLSQIPDSGFDCNSVDYDGFFADTSSQARCQVFWVCHNEQQDGFLCPNGTIFHQRYFTCDWWFNVDCQSSSDFYELNRNIGVVGTHIDTQPAGVVAAASKVHPVFTLLSEMLHYPRVPPVRPQTRIKPFPTPQAAPPVSQSRQETDIQIHEHFPSLTKHSNLGQTQIPPGKHKRSNGRFLAKYIPNAHRDRTTLRHQKHARSRETGGRQARHLRHYARISKHRVRSLAGAVPAAPAAPAPAAAPAALAPAAAPAALAPAAAPAAPAPAASNVTTKAPGAVASDVPAPAAPVPGAPVAAPASESRAVAPSPGTTASGAANSAVGAPPAAPTAPASGTAAAPTAGSSATGDGEAVDIQTAVVMPVNANGSEGAPTVDERVDVFSSNNKKYSSEEKVVPPALDAAPVASPSQQIAWGKQSQFSDGSIKTGVKSSPTQSAAGAAPGAAAPSGQTLESSESAVIPAVIPGPPQICGQPGMQPPGQAGVPTEPSGQAVLPAPGQVPSGQPAASPAAIQPAQLCAPSLAAPIQPKAAEPAPGSAGKRLATANHSAISPGAGVNAVPNIQGDSAQEAVDVKVEVNEPYARPVDEELHYPPQRGDGIKTPPPLFLAPSEATPNQPIVDTTFEMQKEGKKPFKETLHYPSKGSGLKLITTEKPHITTKISEVKDPSGVRHEMPSAKEDATDKPISKNQVTKAKGAFDQVSKLGSGEIQITSESLSKIIKHPRPGKRIRDPAGMPIARLQSSLSEKMNRKFSSDLDGKRDHERSLSVTETSKSDTVGDAGDKEVIIEKITLDKSSEPKEPEKMEISEKIETLEEDDSESESSKPRASKKSENDEDITAMVETNTDKTAGLGGSDDQENTDSHTVDSGWKSVPGPMGMNVRVFVKQVPMDSTGETDSDKSKRASGGDDTAKSRRQTESLVENVISEDAAYDYDIGSLPSWMMKAAKRRVNREQHPIISEQHAVPDHVPIPDVSMQHLNPVLRSSPKARQKSVHRHSGYKRDTPDVLQTAREGLLSVLGGPKEIIDNDIDQVIDDKPSDKDKRENELKLRFDPDRLTSYSDADSSWFR